LLRAAASDRDDGGTRPGPLAGLRVFDLTLWMVGPWAGMQLGALGADVIHIERPDTPPERLSIVPPTIDGTSIGYLAWNMNKRCLGLDLKSPPDLATALQVAATCDVFLVNMRPGVAERIGLGCDALAALNPQIIYCDITGWGEKGPMRDLPGSDGILQGFTGFWSLNGDGGEFYRHYTQLDGSTGNLAVAGVLAGLEARRRTGRGQRIRISMFEAALAMQPLAIALSLAGHEQSARGAAAQLTAPDDVFRCGEGLLLGVSVTTDTQWLALCDALELPELAIDARYSTTAGRVAGRTELGECIAQRLAMNSRAYWQWRLGARGVPFGYPRTFDELRSSQPILDAGLLPEVDTRHWGRVVAGGSPWTFSAHGTSWTAPPLAGEHTDEILAELSALPPTEPLATPSPPYREAASGPLAGVRVVEIADGVAGPHTGLMLAELGADVAKVEDADGDRTRSWSAPDGRPSAVPFAALNRGKRCLGLCLDDVRAIDVLSGLVATADVVVFDTDALSRWPHLQALLDAPTYVVCVLSQNGSAETRGDAPIAELSAQLMSEATFSVGTPGGAPARIGVDLASMHASVFALQAVLAALYARGESHRGEVVEVSLTGALIAMRSTLWVALSNPDEWWGFHLDSYMRRPFPGYRCRNGRLYFDLMHATSLRWFDLLGDLGLDSITDLDPRLALLQDGAGPNSRRAEEAAPIWESAFSSRSVSEVSAILRRHGANVFPVQTYKQALATDQATVLGVILADESGRAAFVRTPWRFESIPSPSVKVESVGASTTQVLTGRGVALDVVMGWADDGLLIGDVFAPSRAGEDDD
jgi:crotonobetainyl-CoA:carnitine CoA-transferase CaiB-like acyl-CoA transferase